MNAQQPSTKKIFKVAAALVVLVCLSVLMMGASSEPAIDIKKILAPGESEFSDFIQCLSSSEYRNPGNMPNIFFKTPHNIEIPQEFGVLKETVVSGRVMILRYTQGTTHKFIFIDLIENRCIRIFTVSES